MTTDFVVKAELRTDSGKGASRRLRHQGKVPAVMYGAGKEPTMLTVAHNEIIRSTEDEAFFSHILTVEYNGTSEKVILKDMQRHPAKIQITHLDFQRIDETHALHVHVPLHFINEDSAPGVKMGGLVSHLMTDIEVSCLPKDLPEYLEVDVSKLELGSSIHLSEVVLPEGVTIMALTHGEEHDLPIASVTMPRGAKEDETGESEEAGEEASE